jgi:hypothetical protein
MNTRHIVIALCFVLSLGVSTGAAQEQVVTGTVHIGSADRHRPLGKARVELVRKLADRDPLGRAITNSSGIYAIKAKLRAGGDYYLVVSYGDRKINTKVKIKPNEKVQKAPLIIVPLN